jgi:nucleoside-diphosphate-sugar epimerase
VTDAGDVVRAAEGCDRAIHSAAVLGGPSQPIEEQEAVNVRGAGHVYDAAAKVGIDRVVALNTTTFFDQTATLTEHSPLDPSPSGDPYTLTKRQAYLDAMARVEQGQDIRIVISGGAYGPSPLPERSMVIPSFNQRAVFAIEGRLSEYVAVPVPWVFVEDVARASVAAMDLGVAGERYLGFGRLDDVVSMVAFCNLACEIAGSPHRLREIPRARLDDPELAARLGPSIVALARKDFPVPWFDDEQTVTRLDYHPLSLREGLERTIPWLRDTGLLSAR